MAISMCLREVGSTASISLPLNSVLPKILYQPVSSPTTTSGTLRASIDPNGGGAVSDCRFEYGPTTAYGLGEIPCEPLTTFSAVTDVGGTASRPDQPRPTYHYRVVVENANGVKYGVDRLYTPHRVVGLETEAADNLAESSATLHASFVGNGEGTHYHFEWGVTEAYGDETAEGCSSPPVPAVREPLSAELTDLVPYTTYHYRVVATNGAGTSYGVDRTVTSTPGVPSVKGEAVSQVHSDRAVLTSTVNPNGADTAYHFEYVTRTDVRSKWLRKCLGGSCARYRSWSRQAVPGSPYLGRRASVRHRLPLPNGRDQPDRNWSWGCPHVHHVPLWIQRQLS